MKNCCATAPGKTATNSVMIQPRQVGQPTSVVAISHITGGIAVISAIGAMIVKKTAPGIGGRPCSSTA